ncbi:MAG: hypothetical protein PVH00_13175 [Gemmatimonadota bacterium]
MGRGKAALRERRFRRTAFWLISGTGLVLVATVGLLVFGGGGPVPGSLQLLALGADGRFGDDVALAAPPDSAVARYPLVLGITNRGLRAAEPRSLRLALPAWFRVRHRDGTPYPMERSEDDPLATVRVTLAAEPVEPGALPFVAAGLDELWLAPDLRAIDCRLDWNGVPVFRPAPPWDPDRLSRITIFWTLEDDRGRLTGLLNVRVPADRMRPPDVRMEFGEMSMYNGAAPRPATGALSFERSGPVTCGEPERPLALSTVFFGTETAGLLIIVLHDGQPRLHLFDLDDDGRIDLEIRDFDGDGVFESRRDVSYPIPRFLIPPA